MPLKTPKIYRVRLIKLSSTKVKKTSNINVPKHGAVRSLPDNQELSDIALNFKMENKLTKQKIRTTRILIKRSKLINLLTASILKRDGAEGTKPSEFDEEDQ